MSRADISNQLRERNESKKEDEVSSRPRSNRQKIGESIRNGETSTISDQDRVAKAQQEVDDAARALQSANSPRQRIAAEKRAARAEEVEQEIASEQTSEEQANVPEDEVARLASSVSDGSDTLGGTDTKATLEESNGVSTPVFGKGHTGSDVELIQTKLRAAGFDIAKDGQFGPETKQALMDYQASKGLAVDGVVGPKTLGSMNVPMKGMENVVSDVSSEIGPDLDIPSKTMIDSERSARQAANAGR